MAGVEKTVDSANLFVENVDYAPGAWVPSGQPVAVTAVTLSAVATGTFNGPDIPNTVHKGARFFANFTVIGATTTVRLNIQAKDPVSGLYVTFASLSLDGITTGTVNTPQLMTIYPGVGTAGGANELNFSDVIARICRVQVSITATASAGGASVTGTVGMTKIV